MEQQDILCAGRAAGRLNHEEVRRRFPRNARNDAPPLPMATIRGDHDLNPGMGPPDRLREAAVLVPLVDRPEGMTVIFTQRTQHLAAHAGQISFPGGRLEAEDPDAEAAALRNLTTFSKVSFSCLA